MRVNQFHAIECPVLRLHRKFRMSPTLLIEDGFKFFFYANEHLPKHIHVVKGDDYATIDLNVVAFRENYLKPADAKKVLKIVEAHRNEFERKWNEFFKR
jgi:hypothetical protein